MNRPDPPEEGATRHVVICNSRGLHARAAAQFVRTAGRFDAEVSVCRNGTSVSGLSIMGLMMLAAGRGAEIVIRASGPDAGPVLGALVTLVEGGFGEDD